MAPICRTPDRRGCHRRARSFGRERLHTGQRPEQCRLSAAVRSEYRYDLAVVDPQFQPFDERGDDDVYVGNQAHGSIAPSQRPRNETSTTKDTANSKRDKANATCSFPWRARYTANGRV